MGSYLDKPMLKKEHVFVSANDHQFVLSAMQGWPTVMEDAHCAVARLEPPFQDWSFYAVFDGHAGGTVSKYASQHLVQLISTAMKSTFNSQPASKHAQSSVHVDPELLKSTIKSCFQQLDTDMRKIEALQGDDKSGATAVAVLLSPSHIYMINCGDSRAVLVRNGSVKFATEDHKPTNPAERKRIEEAGGGVLKKRVNGLLAVSRALGDFDYKSDDQFDHLHQLLSAEPDVEVIPRDNSHDHFVILACDGVWDVMNNVEAMEFVRSRLLLRRSYEIVCDQVADTCLYKGSRDNISIGLILFRHGTDFDERERIKAQNNEDAVEKNLKMKANKIFNEHPNSNDMDMPLLMQLLGGEIEDIKDKLPPGGGLAAMRTYLQELFYTKYPDRKPSEDTSKQSQHSELGSDSTQTQPNRGGNTSQNSGNNASQTSDRKTPIEASRGASGQKQPETAHTHRSTGKPEPKSPHPLGSQSEGVRTSGYPDKNDKNPKSPKNKLDSSRQPDAAQPKSPGAEPSLSKESLEASSHAHRDSASNRSKDSMRKETQDANVLSLDPNKQSPADHKTKPTKK